MTKMLWISLAVVVLGCFQATTGQYVASVVEHHFVNYSTPNITIEENIKLYVYQIESARNQGANIIVFPEYGLTGMVIDPAEYAIEIPDAGITPFSDYFLNRLSAAAVEHQIYVVVNLLEKTTNNSRNQTLYYNTNFVFDKQGAIAAKYRKINLYYEPNLTPGNETVTFTTDFGVTFGIFTCADIMYYHPSRTILVNSSISDIIFPTAWTSYLPFYMSLSVQSAYSLANKVNLLAANLNNPSEAMGGSGIYRKDGIILRRYLGGSPSTVQLSATIDAVDTTRDFSFFGFDILRNETVDPLANYALKYDFTFDKFVFKPLTFGVENQTEEICDGSFCCTFNFDVYLNETNTTEFYKLMAYDGQLKIAEKDVNVKLCNLIACVTDDISSCGQKPNATLTTRFRNITVTGNFKPQTDDFYQPVSLTGDLLPVTNLTYSEIRENNAVTIRLGTNKTESNLVAFGIYGRSSASSFSVSLIVVAVLLLAQKIL